MNDSLEAKFQCRYDGCDKHSHKANRKRYQKTCKKKSFDLPQQKDISPFYCPKTWCSKSFKQSLTVKDMS